MLHKHITIELLTSIQIHYLNKTKAHICAKILNVELKLKDDHSLDFICDRDKLMDTEERDSTETLYRIVKGGYLSFNLLRRKGRRKHKGQEETRGKITNCKSILDRDTKYPRAKESLVFVYF